MGLEGKKFILLTCPMGGPHHSWPPQVWVRWQKTGMKADSESEPLLGIPWEKARQGRGHSLELTSLNNSSRLWALGVISGCPVHRTEGKTVLA